MTLGALMDLGVPLEWLQEKLQAMPLDGFRITKEVIQVHGIQATQVQIDLPEAHVARDYADIKNLIENAPLEQEIRDKSLKIFEKIAIAESEHPRRSHRESSFSRSGRDGFHYRHCGHGTRYGISWHPGHISLSYSPWQWVCGMQPRDITGSCTSNPFHPQGGSRIWRGHTA